MWRGNCTNLAITPMNKKDACRVVNKEITPLL